jgi:hypothetical protein
VEQPLSRQSATIFQQLYFQQRQFDVVLISPFRPREARPKWRKIVPRASRAERFFALVQFTFQQL